MAGLKNLVSAQWLLDHLDHKDLGIIDATFYLPTHGKDAFEEFQKAAIPQAHFFDLNSVKNNETDLPHMLPNAKVFSKTIQSFGLNNNDMIVVYDQHGLFSSARLWWMFKVFGHENVYILNGGLPAWCEAGGKTEPGRSETKTSYYHVATDNSAAWCVDMETLKANKPLWSSIMDARPSSRFNGDDPEPRVGMRSGHIPGALNFPFTSFVKDGKLLPPEQLDRLLTNAPHEPITSCGSGITAAILSLALAETGRPMGKLYDGSWADWGREDAGTEIEHSASTSNSL